MMNSANCLGVCKRFVITNGKSHDGHSKFVAIVIDMQSYHYYGHIELVRKIGSLDARLISIYA